jgi:hypothetical protein
MSRTRWGSKTEVVVVVVVLGRDRLLVGHEALEALDVVGEGAVVHGREG